MFYIPINICKHLKYKIATSGNNCESVLVYIHYRYYKHISMFQKIGNLGLRIFAFVYILFARIEFYYVCLYLHIYRLNCRGELHI